MRFLEWGLRNKIDACVFETGFQRNKTYEFIGASPDGIVSITYTGTIVGHRERKDGDEEVLMAYYDLCDEKKTIVVSGLAMIEKGLKHRPMSGTYKPCEADGIDLRGWSRSSELLGKRISSVAHNILKPVSARKNVHDYRLLRTVHMEMGVQFKEAFFVLASKGWHRANSCLKLKYNAGFFDTFVNDIVELFRASRGNGKYGTTWETFREHWFQFKRSYSSVKTWQPYMKKFFDTRKYSLQKAFKEDKKDSEDS